MSELLRLYRNAQIPYEKFIRYCAIAPVGILPYYDGLLDQYSEADQIFVKRVLELEAKYSALTARIAELEAAQRWIPVTEGLPEFGTSILFYDSILERTNKGTCTALNRDKTNLQWLTDDGIYYHGNRCEYITHWKEEPARPEAQQ